MQEYVTRAVVLDKVARGGDADARYFLFTERFGKIAVRAKSSRKIVSKLAGHLEPGTLAAVRIIEQHGAQVVDALKLARAQITVPDLVALNRLLGEWEPEPELWEELANARASNAESISSDGARQFSWPNILAILGWDPRGTLCIRCASPARPPRFFHLPRQEFFCASCVAASRFRREEVILI